MDGNHLKKLSQRCFTMHLYYCLRSNCDSDLQKLPEDLQYMTYLKEWHIHRTRIPEIPTYIEAFVDLQVLDVPKNGLTKLPPEIGQSQQT